MKLFLTTAAAVSLLAGAAMAQPHRDDRRDDHRGPPMAMGHHHDWHKGGRVDRNDWQRGQRISDYRRYHLRQPPRGYEWRNVDGDYVLGAVATGLIADLLLNNH